MPGTVVQAQGRALLDANRSGRLQATIGRSSDFFGPFVRVSTVGERVFGAVVRHRPAQVLGDPDQPHTYTFVGDFARALIVLEVRPKNGLWRADERVGELETGLELRR